MRQKERHKRGGCRKKKKNTNQLRQRDPRRRFSTSPSFPRVSISIFQIKTATGRRKKKAPSVFIRLFVCLIYLFRLVRLSDLCASQFSRAVSVFLIFAAAGIFAGNSTANFVWRFRRFE